MTSKIESLLAGDRPLRWLFTGDSVTHGAGHTHGDRDYVQLFEERLRWELGRRRDHVIRTAISGRCIMDLEEDLEWSTTQYRPDVVSLMFGLNDCATTEPDVSGFAATYRRVIEAVQSDGAVVLLHTPNRILVTETAERQANLPSYVEAVREVADATGAILVDHYAEWEAAERTGALEYWIDHGCHPNTSGHRVMFRRLMLVLGRWDPSSPTCRLYVPASEALSTSA